MFPKKHHSQEPRAIVPHARTILSIEPFDPATLTITRAEDAGRDPVFREARAQCGNALAFWAYSRRADWMLHVLAWKSAHGWVRNTPDLELRQFAFRCASSLQGNDNPSVQALLQAIGARAHGVGSASEILDVRRQVQETVIAAGVNGLPLFDPAAARLLAAWHAGDGNAPSAAGWAAEFAVRHDAFRAVRKWSQHPEVVRGAMAETRQRQAEWLRELVGNPFEPVKAEDSTTLYLHAACSGSTQAYCAECGTSVEGAERHEVVDGRYLRCSRCGDLLASSQEVA